MMKTKLRVLYLALLMVGGCWLSSAEAAQVMRQAQVSEITGTVEYLKPGSADWKAVTLNQSLSNGDKIRTGADGQVNLSLDDGSTIQLFAGTEFGVESLTKDSDTGDLESILAVLKGKLRADVTTQPEGSRFEFETPVMVAAIRGTVPVITVEDGNVTTENEEGEIVLHGEGDNEFSVTLGEGNAAQVSRDPATGDITIVNVGGGGGCFDVSVGGSTTRLCAGESAVVAGGALTFIPNPGGPVVVPGAEGDFAEPISGTP